MVKSYLRYKSNAPFGIIASSNSNLVFNHSGKLVVSPALDSVNVWDVRRGVKNECWTDEDNKAEVTCICKSAQEGRFAVGYSDGSIRIWMMNQETPAIIFSGHKTAVTALSFDNDGLRLASGSKDTDLLIWDILSERGLYRLRGHRDMITGLKFLTLHGMNHIISISKDTLMKVWDLSTQHCVETIIAHRTELCALEVTNDHRMIITGGVDQEIRVWKIEPELLCSLLEPVKMNESTSEMMDVDNVESAGKRAIVHYGSLERNGRERVLTILMHSSGRYLGIQGADKLVELYMLRTAEEVKKKKARQRKRREEKLKNKSAAEADKKKDEADAVDDSVITVNDEISKLHTIRCMGKIRSFDFSPAELGKDNSFDVICGLSSNQLELHRVVPSAKEEATKLVNTVDQHGHRSDIRTVSLSSDDKLLVSASNDAVKIWDVDSRQCIKTMESDYALCSVFVPGNNHVIIGTKTGLLELYDLASSSLLESYEAHTGPVWSLHLRPDNTGFVTGSADKDVKFWDFSISETNGMKRLTIVHVRTLRMTDDILCVRFSPDSRLLAVSFLDSTIKLFFVDTLKFYLSLYGHKLPVLSMDISSDSTLLVTGSADKTIKIWGLDFGDCHKSLIAHEDSIMACQFVWGTHYIFTGGKDNLIKYWDTDKFEMIMKLEGHQSEVWCLAVGKYGNIVVSGSHDRSIRVWEKTDEQLFLSEEKENEIENLFEQGALKDDERNNLPVGALADGEEYDPVESGREVGEAGKKTMESLKAGERIFEALEIWEEETEKLEQHRLLQVANPTSTLAPPPRNLNLVATGDPTMTAEGYVLRVIERIRSSDLEQALLVLSFAKVKMLLQCIEVWADKGWNPLLTARTLVFVIRLHHPQIVATRSLKPILTKLNMTVSANVSKYRDTVGFNLAAINFLRREWEAEHSTEFIDDVEGAEDKNAKTKKGGKKKRKIVVVGK